MLVAERQFPLALHINQDKKEIPMCNDSIYVNDVEHHEFIKTLKKEEKIKYIKENYPYERVTDTLSFTKKAKWINGDRYDYRKSVYFGTSHPLTIICTKHGKFTQRPDQHLLGKGCSECGKVLSASSNKSNSKDFIKKAKSIHGERYVYDKVDYQHSETKVNIVCRVHGDFFVTPHSHLSGRCGCPKCGVITAARHSASNKKTAEQIIQNAKQIYGDTFTYEKFEYVNTKTRAIVTCRIHGDFLVIPRCHERGEQGCRRCFYDRISINRDKFIKRATEQFGSQFDYSGMVYKDYTTEVKIRCKYHGDFYQAPFNHIRSKFGCPSCFAESQDSDYSLARNKEEYKNIDATLYHLEFVSPDGDSFEKVGITTIGVKKRFNGIHKKYKIKVIGSYEMSLYDAIIVEDNILKVLEEMGERYKKHQLRNSYAGGWTECFESGILNVRDIVEGVGV